MSFRGSTIGGRGKSTVGGSFLTPAPAKAEEPSEFEKIAEERLKEIEQLNEQLKTIGALYDNESKKTKKLEIDLESVQKEHLRTLKSYNKAKDNLTKMKDERDELADKCEVLQEEYDKLNNL